MFDCSRSLVQSSASTQAIFFIEACVNQDFIKMPSQILDRKCMTEVDNVGKSKKKIPEIITNKAK